MIIYCLRLLFNELTVRYNNNELATQRLSQDCLENFFSLIRMKGLNNRHPTPFSIRASYRQVVMTQLLKPNDTNCAIDTAESVLSPKDFSRVNIFNKKATRTTHCLDGEMCDVDCEIVDLAEITNVHYTGSWLLAAIDHNECREKLKGDKKVSCRVNALASMKGGSEREHAGVKFTSLMTSIVQNFKDNFVPFWESSTSGVKERLLNNIMANNSQQAPVCNDCFKKIIGKYLNMLIKANLNEMN